MEKKDFLATCRILLIAPFFFLFVMLLVNGADSFAFFFNTKIGFVLGFLAMILYGSAYALINRMKKSTVSFKNLHVLLLVPTIFILMILKFY